MSKFMNFALTGIVSAIFLAGCGGGSSTTPAAVVTAAATTFALQSGYKTRVASGSTDNFTISGTCSGSATMSDSTPSSATFEGSPALSVTVTATISFTNCTPSSNASTSTGYYDSNYNPLGYSTIGVDYGKFLTIPSPLPVSVKVGDTAVFGTETIYADSTKQITTGQRTLSYVIETDGASTSTAIANLITKQFNTSSQLLFTQQSRYRMAADGTLTIVSIDVQYATTSTNHLVYTK